MVENRKYFNLFCHAMLLLGVAVVAFPVYVAFCAATMNEKEVFTVPLSLVPGTHLLANMATVWNTGAGSAASPFSTMLMNSVITALVISVGKIAISIISAYAIVFFRFPFRRLAFWLIFVTLMLPVEVRIVPTYQVVASLGMVDSYSGLIVPLIASATATFLFRQFFLSVPDELTEAARIDGAGPVRFFIDILLPMSRTSIAALFVIQFIYGWNQYLWPLLITTREGFYTVVMTLSRQVNTVDAAPSWNWIMAMAMLAMLPPVLVVVFMQRQFIKGLVDTEK